MTTVVNRASDEAFAKEAYARVKGDWASLASDQLLQVNLEVQQATQTILGALPEIKPFRGQLAEELPKFDLNQFDRLEDYALALIYVQSRYAMATQPPNDLGELSAEAGKLRDILAADAHTLSLRGLFDARKVAALRGGNGYKNLAQDLQSLATELEAVLPSIQGKGATTIDDINAATQMATRLTRVIGTREQSPAVVAQLVEERSRAFTQLLKAYEDARSAITYVRRERDDVDDIAPNLYAGNAKRKKVSEPEVPLAHAPLTPIPGTVAAVTPPGQPALSGTPAPATMPKSSADPFVS